MSNWELKDKPLMNLKNKHLDGSIDLLHYNTTNVSGTLAKLDVLTNIPTNMFINPVLCLKLVFKTYLVIIGWIEIKL